VPPLLDIHELSKVFELPRKSRLPWESKEFLTAVDSVSITVDQGEVLGVVGESGSGKTTVARCIVGLERATNGTIVFEGTAIDYLNARKMRSLRRKIQMVFQDSFGSLDPRQTVHDIVDEPLKLLTDLDTRDRRSRVEAILAEVGLSRALANRYRHELSGGQQQRINFARALVTHPELVVLDEPVSSLDASVRMQVIGLLKSLQEAFQLSYLFISHDLHTVQELCDRVAIMCLGRIVEVGRAFDIFTAPAHPYTKQLLASRLALSDPPRRLHTEVTEGPRRPWLGDAKWSFSEGLSPRLVPLSATHFVAQNPNGNGVAIPPEPHESDSGP
jgi:ABC-type oligopeptide transport system ATPase subunit